MCGFGIDRHPSKDSWKLDVSGCGDLGGIMEARDEFKSLQVLNLDDNELEELPAWLGGGEMGVLRELRARGNRLEEAEVVKNLLEASGNGTSGVLELVDLGDNDIAHVSYELMDVESEGTRLLLDGNPVAAEVDWSGLAVERLPARMVESGYDNGAWNSSLKLLKLAHNTFQESVFGDLAAANFSAIEELDVSWNRLGGIPEGGLGAFAGLRKLDVSGHSETISAK